MGLHLLKVCLSLNSPAQTAILGFVRLWAPPSNRHLGVCVPPPVAAHRCRRPAHPLVSVSMRCGLASCWCAEWFEIGDGMHQLPPTLFVAAPMVGASPDNIRAQRLAEGGVPASEAGSATNQSSDQCQ